MIGTSNLLVKYTWDESKDVKTMLNDLQNNILSAIILVVIVIIAILGTRTAFLVGVSIPGSFLTGLLVLAIFGLTVNIVVLFSLIMAVGMLVDGAIVVTEFADRRMQEGVDKKYTYRDAAKRMAYLLPLLPLLRWLHLLPYYSGRYHGRVHEVSTADADCNAKCIFGHGAIVCSGSWWVARQTAVRFSR